MDCPKCGAKPWCGGVWYDCDTTHSKESGIEQSSECRIRELESLLGESNCHICQELEAKIKAAIERLMILSQRKDLPFKHLGSIARILNELKK